MGNVQEQQDMKERRKQQNICESCFEEHPDERRPLEEQRDEL